MKKSKADPPTKEELKWIDDFKKLAKRCPKSLWLYATGTLCIMKTPSDGNELGGGFSGDGVNRDNIIDTINIKNDGGDF